MKINLATIDTTNFKVNKHTLYGQDVYLVNPILIGCKWTTENKIFRSSLWDSNGNLISASFAKFTNWQEDPITFPVPQSLDNTKIVEKIDGSTCILSKWNGNYIIRTRGTVDATKLDNGYEIELFKNTYLKKIANLFPDNTWNHSLIFEWVSPANTIIIKYDKPDWFLTGYINHEDYSLAKQETLDQLAIQIGCPRPKVYDFPSIEDLFNNVEKWSGKEGVVVYSKDGQTLHKIKSLQYLKKHRFKSNANIKTVTDLYLSMNRPDKTTFEAKLVESFDYECYTMVKDFVNDVCGVNTKVNNIIDEIDGFVLNTLKPLPTRKEQAEKTISTYNNQGLTGIVFLRLNNNPISVDTYKKLFYKYLNIQ